MCRQNIGIKIQSPKNMVKKHLGFEKKELVSRYGQQGSSSIKH
tara:strand:- start:757 stop:885 length:129 start_codon:yes stop_codon:yes gene_type:complete